MRYKKSNSSTGSKFGAITRSNYRKTSFFVSKYQDGYDRYLLRNFLAAGISNFTASLNYN
ncbi:MAG: hypothetical protein ACLSV2_04680 [Clostridium sp.]